MIFVFFWNKKFFWLLLLLKILVEVLRHWHVLHVTTKYATLLVLAVIFRRGFVFIGMLVLPLTFGIFLATKAIPYKVRTAAGNQEEADHE